MLKQGHNCSGHYTLYIGITEHNFNKLCRFGDSIRCKPVFLIAVMGENAGAIGMRRAEQSLIQFPVMNLLNN